MAVPGTLGRDQGHRGCRGCGRGGESMGPTESNTMQRTVATSLMEEVGGKELNR